MISRDMDKTKATPTRAGARSVAASPTTAPPFSAYGSRSRLAGGRAPPFSPTASRSRLRRDMDYLRHAPMEIPALTSLRPDVDYSKNPPKMMKLRLVPEEEWFPHQRHPRHLTGNEFWTVLQKDLYLYLKKQISDMRWIDWALVNQSTGTDVRRYFAATPGLDKLLGRMDFKWADSYIHQFYATLWIQPDRSRIRFMFGDQQRELSRVDFAECLGLSLSGARVHSLAYPSGNRVEDLPPVESLRHLYNNPGAVMEPLKDHNQLNNETAVVHAIMRISIRPISGDSLTAIDIWILHLLMSAEPIDVVDLMIGEMQEIILNIRQRRLPYAPYLIGLFYTKKWLKDGMNNALVHLKPYRALKPKNRALQPVKSYKAPQLDALSDVAKPAHSDGMLGPGLEEHTLVVTTNEEDDPHLVPAPVPDEFGFSQPEAHDVEAGGSGCDADVPPMLQSRGDRQTALLELMHGQLAGLQGQMTGLQVQMAEFQQQHEHDCQQTQGQLAVLQGQIAQVHQENRDLRNLGVVSVSHTLRNSSHHRDVLALLDESFSAFRGL